MSANLVILRIGTTLDKSSAKIIKTKPLGGYNHDISKIQPRTQKPRC